MAAQLENEPDLGLVVFEREFYWRDVQEEQWHPKPITEFKTAPEGRWLAVKVMQNYWACPVNCYPGLRQRWKRTKNG